MDALTRERLRRDIRDSQNLLLLVVLFTYNIHITIKYFILLIIMI